MVTSVSGKRIGVELAVGLAPADGPRSVTQTINFATETSPKTVNFTETTVNDVIEFVQSIYCDNSQNPYPLSILCSLTFQTLTWPPYSQGYLPVLATRQVPEFTVSTSGQVVVGLCFCSMMQPAQIWFPGSASGAGAPLQAGTATIVTPGTAVPLSATSYVVQQGVVITSASGNNAAGLAVGNSSVNDTIGSGGNGAFLYPSGQIGIPAGVNLNAVYINSANMDTVGWEGI